MTYNYDFIKAKEEWINCPIDDINYFNTEELNKNSDDDIKNLMDKFIKNRYTLEDNNTIPKVCKKGWRNYKNLWREHLIDDVRNKIIFDFGCGYGIESLQFLNNNNQVIIGDINNSTLIIAERVLNIYHKNILDKILVENNSPYFKLNTKIDIFYSNGVLHHTPNIREILLEAVKYLNQDGEIRLMLYSDIAWKTRTKTDPPRNYNVSITTHPKYNSFLRKMDAVGLYADWYDKSKIETLFGDFLILKKFLYITSTKDFCVAILKPKNYN